MLVGLEVELHAECISYSSILREEGLSLHEFKEITPGLGVKMSEEYYSSTIEYNFSPFELSKEGTDLVKDFLSEQKERYDLYLNGNAPAYVGTHVHIFDSGMLRKNKERLLKGVLSFIVDNMDGLSKDSVRRMMFAQQLWANWCHQNNGDWYREVEGLANIYYYENNTDKVKYRPIILSPRSRTGKPKSLEIRIIPNDFIFNGKIYDLLKEIEDGTIYDRPKVDMKTFIQKGVEFLNGRRVRVEEEVDNTQEENIVRHGQNIPSYALNTDALTNLSEDDVVPYSELDTYRQIGNSRISRSEWMRMNNYDLGILYTHNDSGISFGAFAGMAYNYFNGMDFDLETSYGFVSIHSSISFDDYCKTMSSVITRF